VENNFFVFIDYIVLFKRISKIY